MPGNFQVQDDKVYTITILVDDGAGNPVTAPAGDTFTSIATHADGSDASASLGLVIGADANGNAAVVATPLVAASPNITITTKDATGLKPDVTVVDISTDTTPVNVALDLAHAATTPQAVPTAPGP